MNECAHVWEDAGFTSTETGVKWKHVDRTYFCRLCRGFTRRSTQFLDGSFGKPEKVAEIRKTEQAAYRKACEQYLNDHPEDG